MSFIRSLVLVLLCTCSLDAKFSCPFPIEGELFLDFDDFRGISDGSWNGNTGGVIGGNFGTHLWGPFGVQAGGSYGVYDWYGRGSVAVDTTAPQQQGFVTLGFFQKADCSSGLQTALLYDCMFNRNFGVFAVNPTLDQLRFHVGYLLNRCNEFGFWGTYNLNTEHKIANEILISYRAVSQANLFWRHYFKNCAETILWVGVPYRHGLMFPKKLSGSYIVGGAFKVPLTRCLNVEAHGVYMGPRNYSGSPRFQNYSSNICIGINYAFGLGSGCCDDLQKARPFLPVANNSNFLVDSSFNN